MSRIDKQLGDESLVHLLGTTQQHAPTDFERTLRPSLLWPVTTSLLNRSNQTGLALGIPWTLQIPDKTGFYRIEFAATSAINTWAVAFHQSVDVPTPFNGTPATDQNTPENVIYLVYAGAKQLVATTTVTWKVELNGDAILNPIVPTLNTNTVVYPPAPLTSAICTSVLAPVGLHGLSVDLAGTPATMGTNRLLLIFMLCPPGYRG